MLIAFTYIGTVVGAGFASGREIRQFFLADPDRWPSGIVVATAAFIALGLPLVRLGFHAGDSVFDALKGFVGRRLAALTDAAIGLFLFGGLCIMIAGGGAALEQVFHVRLEIGLLGMAALTWWTVRGDIAGLKLANALVVPALVVITALVWAIARQMPQAPMPAGEAAPSAGMPVLYALFNTALALPVILSLGASARQRHSADWGLILGVIGVAFLIAAVATTLLVFGETPFEHEIPMLYIAEQAHPWLHPLYFVALLGEIYTTAIGNLFGVAKSLAPRLALPLDQTAALVSLLALGLSYIGFASLVETLYPLFGYAMGGLIALALLRWGVRALSRPGR